MVRSQGRWVRALAYGGTAVLVLAACSQAAAPTTNPTSAATTNTGTPAATVAATTAALQNATPAATTATATGTPSTTSVPATATATGTPEASAGESSQPSASGGTQTAGGTIYLLKNATDFDYYDPQRVYTGEDLAFFGATTMRSLVAYKYSPDPAEGTTVVPDMATDI